MARDRGSNPTRRGPSRHGRASFEQDAANTEHDDRSNDGNNNSNDRHEEGSAGGQNGMNERPQDRHHQLQQDSASGAGGVNSPTLTIPGDAENSTENGGPLENNHVAEDDNSNNKDNIASTSVSSRAPPTPAPRGRGRPRKKPLEGATSPSAASLPPTPKASTSVSPRGSVATPSSSSGGGGGDGTYGYTGAGQEDEEEDDGQGRESDDWSEEDNVHYLPSQTKAQFGNVSEEPWGFVSSVSCEGLELLWDSAVVLYSWVPKYAHPTGSPTAIMHVTVQAVGPCAFSAASFYL